jgi:hypothetical protein
MTEPNKKSEIEQEIFAGYKGGEDMPLAGYAGLLFVYNAALFAALQAADKAGYELPEKVNYGDLILLGVATHKLSRIITKDRVTSPLRAPFTEYIEPAGESEIKEKVRGRGLQRAIGDLLICPWCMNPWVAGALALGFVFKPRATRFLTGIFSAVTIADFLHEASEAAKKK